MTNLAKLANNIIMKTVSIHDAKTNLSKYIAAAKQGEQIYIGSHGKPEVKLAFISPAISDKKPRRLGLLKGKISVSPDAFTKKTDKEIADLMYGEQ